MNRVNHSKGGSARLWMSVMLVLVLLGVWSATAAGDNNAPPTGAQLSAVPGMPENLQASQGTQVNQVRVTWPAVSGATYYRVRRAVAGGVNWPLVGTQNTNLYVDMIADHNVKYDYRVAACNAHGCSAFSWPPVTGWMGLAVPTNVQASKGTYEEVVSLSWNAVTAAKWYMVYKSRDTMGWEWEFGALDAPIYDRSATPGTLYYWWVKACNDITCSALSSSDTGYRRLGTPTGVTASDGAYCDRVRVAWAPTEGATYYQVSRATASGADRVEFTAYASSFDDMTAPFDSAWYYWIRACAPTGCGYSSTPVSGYRGAPPAPVHIASTHGNYPDRVGVSWTPVNGATTYQLYRGTSPASMPLLVSGISADSYYDYSIQCGTTYYYGVAACNACGCGPRYGNVTGWTQCPPPAPPTNVQATIGLVSHVIVTWNVSAGAEGYKIYRGSTPNSAQAQPIGLVTQGSTTSYSDWGASCHTPYYWVAASSSGVDSQLAGPAMGAPDGCGGGGGVTETPEPTNTTTRTATMTLTRTPTRTPTRTVTPSVTSSAGGGTLTPTPTQTNTPTPTVTGTLNVRPSPTTTLPARPTAIWTPVSWLYLPMVIK